MSFDGLVTMLGVINIFQYVKQNILLTISLKFINQ